MKPVHQARVSIRRTRAVLSALGARKRLRDRDRALKALLDALGPVRDVHVRLAWLSRAKARRRLSEETSAALARLERQERASLPGLERALLDAWRRWHEGERRALQQAIRRWRGPLVLGEVGTAALSKRVKRTRAARRRWERRWRDQDAHRLRIALKKLRYEAEALRPAAPEAVDGLVGHLKALQTALGDLHDADVRLSWLSAYEDPALAPVVAHERRRRRALERKARALVESVKPGRKGRAVVKALAVSGGR